MIGNRKVATKLSAEILFKMQPTAYEHSIII